MSPSPTHAHRLDTVARRIVQTGAARVLDLGCGPGELMARLLEHPAIEHIVGLDESSFAMQLAGEKLQGHGSRASLAQRSFCDPDLPWRDFDAAALVETIEHIEPQRLGELERAVFARLRPRHVFVTTPNAEYNPLLGLAPGQLRHHDHRFEWDRTRFRGWARGVASRNGYRLGFMEIGESDPELGAVTQMAEFALNDGGAIRCGVSAAAQGRCTLRQDPAFA